MHSHHGAGCLRLLALIMEEATRETEERVAAERKKREDAEPAIPPGPRVICTKCPAVAKVHHHKMTSGGSIEEIWVECHGEHVFGSFFQTRAPGEDLLFHKIVATDPGAVSRQVNEAAKYLGDKSADMLIRLRYLEASAWRPGPKRIHELFELAERNMLFWQEHVVLFQKKLKA